MRRIVLLTTVLLVMCGCASLRGGDGGVMQRFTQSRNLVRATGLLEAGDRPGAMKALTAVTDSGGFSGITDEALFRLALLSLHPSAERDSNSHALLQLKRLKKEYPASPWTAQSGQLLELLSGVDELRRQVKNLRSQNQALSSEVNELKRNIDQLKSLDQELEKRRR